MKKYILFIVPNEAEICKEKFKAQNGLVYILFNLIVITFIQHFLSAFYYLISNPQSPTC
jgi:hypothetical protein